MPIDDQKILHKIFKTLQFVTLSDIATADGKSVHPDIINMTKIPTQKSRIYWGNETYKFDSNKRHTWARFIQHVTAGSTDFKLPIPLGRWIDTTGMEFITYCKEDDSTIIHKDDRQLHYYYKVGRTKTTRRMTFQRGNPDINTINPKGYHRTDMKGSFHDNRDTWTQLNKDTDTATRRTLTSTLYDSIQRDRQIGFVSVTPAQTRYLLECLKDPNMVLHASTNGTVKNSLGGFGYIVYQNPGTKLKGTNRDITHTICEGYGPADGYECDSTRAELGGPLAIILLI